MKKKKKYPHNLILINTWHLLFSLLGKWLFQNIKYPAIYITSLSVKITVNPFSHILNQPRETYLSFYLYKDSFWLNCETYCSLGGQPKTIMGTTQNIFKRKIRRFLTFTYLINCRFKKLILYFYGRSRYHLKKARKMHQCAYILDYLIFNAFQVLHIHINPF